MSKQMKETGSIMLLIATALFVGFTVGFLTGILGISHWWTLPGGSISGGMMAGIYYPSKRLPIWYRIIIGICAGFLGWLISLFVAQAIIGG